MVVCARPQIHTVHTYVSTYVLTNPYTVLEDADGLQGKVARPSQTSSQGADSSLSNCVCMYAYVYIYVRVCMYVCMYRYEYVHTCTVCTGTARYARAIIISSTITPVEHGRPELRVVDRASKPGLDIRTYSIPDIPSSIFYYVLVSTYCMDA